MNNIEERIAFIGEASEALRVGWKYLVHELDSKLADLTEQLINNDSERIRGQILAMRWVKDLPAMLQTERVGLSEAITEQAASD